MRQPWLNVFAIHDVETNVAKIYVYHEGEANKSPDEACSLLLHDIKKKYQIIENIIF